MSKEALNINKDYLKDCPAPNNKENAEINIPSVDYSKKNKEERAELIKKGMITPTRWTRNDINILMNYYEKGGVNKCQRMGINKKGSSIRMMARALNIQLKKEVIWTKEEDDLIRDAIENNKGREYCYANLEDKTKVDINARIKELDLLQKKKWTKTEKEILKKYYPKGGARLVIEHGVNRSVKKISAKASNMGIKIEKSRNYWSNEDEEILKKYYPVEGIAVEKRIKGKTRQNIRNKVRYMKLKGPRSSK